MPRSCRTFRILATLSFLCFFATLAKSQTTCPNNASPTASLTLSIEATPPPQSGLQLVIVATRYQGGNGGGPLPTQVIPSSFSREYTGLCPGRYSVLVQGSGYGTCGYHANKQIVLHEHETRKLKIIIREKKDALCE
jgi:hypothetical protein